MILFIDSNGTVLGSDVTRVYQGQNVANSITIVAPFPITNAVSVGFELPNGVRTTNYALTPIAPIDDVKNVLGDGYSFWQWQTKNGAVTELAGTVLGQFFIAENGETIATGSFSFTVEQGTQPIIPPTPDSDTWQAILSLYNDLSAKLVNKVLNDFTVDATTGIGTKYYNDGTTATIQFPVEAPTTVFKSMATVITFASTSFVQEADGTYSLAFPNTQTGMTNNVYSANIAEAQTINDKAGYTQRADAYFLGSDGSILIEGIETPFNGRLILFTASILEGQDALVSDLSYSNGELTVEFIDGQSEVIEIEAVKSVTLSGSNLVVTKVDGTSTNIQIDSVKTQDTTSTAVTLQAQPKNEYYYGELTSITLTFANGQLGDLFYIKFDSGTTPTDIIFDNVSNAVWDTDFTAEANKAVEICGKWDGSKWLILMTQL